ncbi:MULTISPECIES: hypothetical protein [Pseudoalteromonas]|uniref:Uncharacterized protein n=1 Tax=Pseudoalteromonas amylolytica TaxID=1859457 RepID=A0A1S1MXU6_9GAMM|nr:MULTISPECIES: hypothetical protein [Pseudoalteromonas]OHU85537.1 hypothetical protein BFC16_19505 [Pseudoalteromonas sp. JW3]OHU91771.1 hypothetical protein BET10_08200 [Pseudoalteromonas amylolytica]
MSEELTNAVTALQNVSNKHEQLNAQYQGTHDALTSNTQAMTDWQTQSGTVELTDQNGNKHATPTLKTLVAQAQSVNPHPDVMSKAQFEALCQMRKQQYAGSGFVEWGKHNSGHPKINEGLWQYVAAGAENSLTLGDIEQNTYTGISRSFNPIVVIDGVQHVVAYVGRPNTQNRPTFPKAPDGTKTYDSATGTVTQHSNAEVAFASETDTNKVITSRKDLVFLESWHEKIADKDVVYPLGNVQYGASSYEGITLLNNLVAQGYSAFGEWDQNTKGYGVKWSTLTDEQKAIFLGEPEHNIYFDPKAKAYIQVRYRVRVVEGTCNSWSELRPSVSERTTEWALVDRRRIAYVQGSSEDISPRIFLMKGHSQTTLTKEDKGVAEGEGSTTGLFSYGQTKPLGIPIALVQRLNQGAYHPSYNPMGVCGLATVSNPDSQAHCTKWYQDVVTQPTSAADCFDVNVSRIPSGGYNWGSIELGWSGRSDQYQYYDAIYAGQVEDLRLNANKLDVNQLREETMRKAVAGTLRGQGSQLFTRFKSLNEFFFSNYNVNSNVYFRTGPDHGDELIDFQQMGFDVNESIMVWQPSTGYVGYGALTQHTGHLSLHQSQEGLGKLSGDYKSSLSRHERCYIASVQEVGCFDNLPWVDIVGTPENIAATFPDGVVGQWLPKQPDSSSGYPLNKKMSGASLNATYTADQGQTWNNQNVSFDETTNTNTSSWGSDDVVLLSYQTQACFTHAGSSAPILGSVGDVYATQSKLEMYGNRLQPSLICKIGTRANGAFIHEQVKVSRFSKHAPTGKLYWTSLSGDEPRHDGLSLDSQSEPSSAIKTLYTLIEKDGLLYLQFNGTELKHNGTDWGDDQTIPIINGENVKTDMNGNTVKVFCHHTQIPIGIAYNN